MSTQDKACELLAKDCQHDHHLHETMTTRAAKAENTAAETLDEKARELAAEERLRDKNLGDNMLSRSEAEINQ